MAWTSQGPRPGTEGQSEGVTDREIVGAVNAVAPHSSDADVLYIGAVNGGVWKTEDARAARPNWRSLMPDETSLSIGALCLDRADITSQTLVAGTGRFSSMRRVGGALLGVMRSVDDGANWTIHDNQGVFRALHIRAVHAHGDVIVLAGNANFQSLADGVYRSSDGGLSFSHLSDGPLRAGRSLALAASPMDPDVIYAHAGDGLFRSGDGGDTWLAVSIPIMESRLAVAANVRIAPGLGDNVFVAVATGTRARLSDLYHSADAGATWTALDLPTTTEGNQAVFGIHPGGQGGIHFSTAADMTDGTVVYIGGDRQPAFNEGSGAGALRQFPNSINAGTYSGRLFRVDASRPIGQQASPLTHVNTASNSAPHADSRCMAIDADGNLIEGDDGGVYRRLDPRSDLGDWQSAIGTLANTEAHSGAWDANARMMLVGTQDNGTLAQDSESGTRWPTVMGGDGGVVAVSLLQGPAGGSVRYSSFQNLGAARRTFFDASGQPVGAQRLQLLPVGTSMNLRPQFYTPIQTNRANSGRIVLCGANAVWESFDRGDTIRVASPLNVRANGAAAVAYGSDTDPDILYVGARREIFVRQGPLPSAMTAATPISFTQDVSAVALDPAQPTTAFATTFDSVHHTDDAGQTWADITSDLLPVGGRTIRSVIWCGNVGEGFVVVGTNAGVFASEGPAFANWQPLGTGIPAVPVMQLQYDAADMFLMAATLGRGVWSMPMTVPTPPVVVAVGGAASGDTVASG